MDSPTSRTVTPEQNSYLPSILQLTLPQRTVTSEDILPENKLQNAVPEPHLTVQEYPSQLAESDVELQKPTQEPLPQNSGHQTRIFHFARRKSQSQLPKSAGKMNMNLPQTVMSNSVVTQPSTLFSHQPQFPPHSQWQNSNEFNAYHLPLQLSQYYNVFPDVPSTKTSWTFPNGCVTSNIVRFTGCPSPTYPVAPVATSVVDDYKPTGMAPVKRKSPSSAECEQQPNKIFISEEKMAAKMSGMHISHDFVRHNTSDSSIATDSSVTDEILACAPETASEPQLVVCDELKNLNKDMNCIIPEPLVPFENTSTALVLWRPPKSYLNVVQIPEDEEYPHRSSVIITDITDRPDLDNNNISTVDLNTLLNPPTK
ncbi:hypothetical protein V9T40_005510 [Parthenolecanium corni]|uniref:Uncharacterized protein n=1 Tax=Parthenolecanium corni TaxID=536013 RepID=A0AAN9TW05_9HEMI